MTNPVNILARLKAIAEKSRKDHVARYDCFNSSEDLAEVVEIEHRITLLERLESLLTERQDVVRSGAGY